MPTPETERSFAAPTAPSWRAEPFRVFFPLAVALGWVGVAPWLLYDLGLMETYSCLFHGLVQMEAFMMAFALGFLFTALPRRTRSAAPSAIEMTIAAGCLGLVAWESAAERWAGAQLAYAAIFVLLLRFALRRFLAGGGAARRPPAAFVLIPIGVAHGLGGALLIAASTFPDVPSWTLALGRLLVEQGVFLCFATGVGSLVLPLMAGEPPPPDLDASPRERWKAAAYAAAGLTILASLVAEQLGAERGGPLVRAAVVALGLGLGGGAWRRPGKPGLHRRLVWLATWLMPVGLAVAGLWPDYRVPALHVLFIGGFSLMAYGVASHVVFGHLDLGAAGSGRPAALIVLGITFIVALLARVAADLSHTYFDHLAWGAACWLTGSLAWLVYFGPKLLTRRQA
ncbi:MAG TPA: NnrS family protein [Candidatus Binatia bacterium]|jgi:hypothetical protein